MQVFTVEASAQVTKSRRGGYNESTGSGRLLDSHTGGPPIIEGSEYPLATSAAVMRRPLSLLNTLAHADRVETALARGFGGEREAVVRIARGIFAGAGRVSLGPSLEDHAREQHGARDRRPTVRPHRQHAFAAPVRPVVAAVHLARARPIADAAQADGLRSGGRSRSGRRPRSRARSQSARARSAMNRNVALRAAVCARAAATVTARQMTTVASPARQRCRTDRF